MKRGGRPVRKGRKKAFLRRRKVCRMCADKRASVDYKDIKFLQGYIVERSKILPRRISGNCARHQRMIQQAIKRARHVALLAYVSD